MEFLFQIVFPENHLLSRYTLVMFLAIDDADEEWIVPPWSCGELSRGLFSRRHLAEQQRLHAVFLFDRDDVSQRSEIVSPVDCRRLVLADGPDESRVLFGELRSRPRWILDDETPLALEGEHPGVFCLSGAQDLVLPPRQGAPAQIVVDYFCAAGKRPENAGYSLFAGNAVYFFAYPGVDPRVCVVVQSE